MPLVNLNAIKRQPDITWLLKLSAPPMKYSCPNDELDSNQLDPLDTTIGNTGERGTCQMISQEYKTDCGNFC